MPSPVLGSGIILGLIYNRITFATVNNLYIFPKIQMKRKHFSGYFRFAWVVSCLTSDFQKIHRIFILLFGSVVEYANTETKYAYGLNICYDVRKKTLICVLLQEKRTKEGNNFSTTQFISNLPIKKAKVVDVTNLARKFFPATVFH